jgi:hypothetical protein
MATLRESTTAVIVRGENWATGARASEPYECGWATEAVLFLRLLKLTGDPGGAELQVEISADGMHWVAEGSRIKVPSAVDAVSFAKVGHFGAWIRVTTTLPEGMTCQALVTLHLK